MNYRYRKKLNKNRRQRFSRHKKRTWILQSFFLGVLGLVIFRIAFIQHIYAGNLLKQAKLVQDRSQVILAKRGEVLDATGQPLVYDVPAYWMDLKTSSFRQNESQLANILAPELGEPSSKILPILQANENGWMQWPHLVLEPAEAKITAALTAMKHSQDVTFTPSEETFYPNGSYAANTLGLVGANGAGETGLEAEYNSILSGVNGQETYTVDGTGYPIQSTIHVTKPAKPGDNIQTTISPFVQGVVEQQMNDLVKKFKPKHAAIIVTNPQTGAILGMSSSPTFNPNNYGTVTNQALQNWAVSSSFEPGSTFKPIVLAAALATHSVTLNHKYKSGQITIDGQTIHDWNYVGWGILTYQEALEKSSNVGFAKIAMALGWPNLNYYMKLFGFFQPTGVDLPGEGTSILFPQSEQTKLTLATSGFGQGISVTPLQQVAAIGAIANGGKLMKPYIVSKITSPSGQVVKTIHPTVVRQNFVSQSALNAVRQTMVLDVSGSQGIDTTAQISGYAVAGKTGTAQIVNPKTGKYYNKRFITSFIGFAPANDPQIEVYVTVDSPNTSVATTWGSTVAAPEARNIMKAFLQYRQIPPQSGIKAAATHTTPPEQGHTHYVQIPSVVGQSIAKANVTLTHLGIKPETIEAKAKSGTIQEQWPTAGIKVPTGSKLYEYSPSKSSKNTMPNLVGCSLQEAESILSLLHMQFTVVGTGYVSHQSIKAGQPINPGMTVAFTLASP